MSATLLFEIGCEELPASAIDIALDFLPKALEKSLREQRISLGLIKAFGTPRRLLISAHDLSAKQEDIDTEITGPSAQIAFDKDNNLTKAGLGFLKSKNIDPQKYYTKESPKGLVLAAKYHEIGKPTEEILSQILPDLLSKIPFKKTMRWDKSGVRFARPVRWLLCLLDKKIINFNFGEVKSSNYSCGHRLLSPEFCEVNLEDYFSFLEKNHILLDNSKRRESILEQAEKLAKSVGGVIYEDLGLLNIVTNLVEYPWAILGEFEKEYLEIPQEILIKEMREHQKYFSIVDKTAKLLPYFVVISNAPAKDVKKLAAGNARVLRARFEDGAFYYQEDLKKKFEDFADDNLKDLTSWCLKLAEKLNLENKSNLERAAYLSKADLNTGVVGEFPELQGLMGGIYAEKSGEKQEVCQALAEQYWPRFSGDKVPSTKTAALLSLANRLDILHTRKLPKGSADPYALRRAAIGFSKIILEHKFNLDLDKLVFKKEILEFINSRARGVFLENYSVLVVDASREAAQNNLCLWQARITALDNFDYQDVAAVFKRVKNIVSKDKMQVSASSGLTSSQIKLLKEPAERALLESLNKISITDNFEKLLSQLASLKPKLADFFDQIMVMVDDKNLRESRLALLISVQEKAAHVADFSKLGAYST